MIAHLRGRVAHRDAATVVVEVHGVGYLVHVAPSDALPAVGEEVELHTSLQVREESMTLYGFPDRSSLYLFELLLTSSGVGPKLALACLATHRPEVLRTAVAGGDLATLTAVPGVGKKVAERLVLELKDKIGSPYAGAPPAIAASATTGDAQQQDVRDALLALGYSAAEAHEALRALDGAVDDASGLLRRALRHLDAAAHA